MNAQLVNSTTGNGTISKDWGTQGEIGSTLAEYDFDGFVDEFYMFTKALSKEDILVLVQACTYGMFILEIFVVCYKKTIVVVIYLLNIKYNMITLTIYH